METPRERDRVQCKFYAHGACLKGEHCEYAHDWRTPPNNICTFYQRGACAYGNRCRYDHVKMDSFASSSSRSKPEFAKLPLLTHPTTTTRVPAWDQPENEVSPGPTTASTDPADHPICSFAAAGHCPRGVSCPHLHGDLCPTCGKLCLHPFRPLQREEHSLSCQKLHQHLDSLKRSQDIECSVCLERVLAKPKPKDRKFGLLSECDHPFCISCIRGWRSTCPSSGMDVNSTLRACPICRKLSYFVIPSVIWYFSQAEKDEILDSYKAKLKSIDCKHFDFGDGSCPFGSSCFYKHSYRDGTPEEVSLRHLGAADGHTVIAKDIRLMDFFDNLHIS